MITETKRPVEQRYHKWEDAGLGAGPYRFLDVFSIPSPPDAAGIGAVEAYNAALTDLAHKQRSLGVTGGSCQVCGMPLTHNYVFQNAAGQRFVVGCDCADRAGEMTSAAEQAFKRSQAAKQAAETRARWNAQLDALGADGFVSLNQVRSDARRLAQAEWQRAQAQMAVEAAQQNLWLIQALDGMSGSFAPAMVERLSTHHLSEQHFTPRQISVMANIYGKLHGRAGSKKYNAAVDEFYQKAGIEG